VTEGFENFEGRTKTHAAMNLLKNSVATYGWKRPDRSLLSTKLSTAAPIGCWLTGQPLDIPQ